MVGASELANVMQAEAFKRDRIQARKEAAEKSGQYDKVILCPQ
jgi:hypothetical protein